MRTGRLAVVVLAAGAGTRMNSKTPKVLHAVAGRPMLGHVLKAVAGLDPARIVVVTGHGATEVEEAFRYTGVSFTRQTDQRGTGHAFLQARIPLQGFDGDILVVYGDTPLMRTETLQAAIKAHRSNGAGMTVITANINDPTGYGRILRGEKGEITGIVEEKAATIGERLINEINSGVYIFSKKAFKMAEGIGCDNPVREYYLTDILGRYQAAGDRVEAFVASDADEFVGVNDRNQLSFAEKVLRDRIRQRVMQSGVTLIDPATTYIDDTVEIEPDAVIYPGVFLEGHTYISSKAQIGPHSRLVDSVVEVGASIVGWTVVESARIGTYAKAGPFARLRPGTVLESHSFVGNFVEVKNSTIGHGAKASHLSYIGDAIVGTEANIGAGTITANYDGAEKHHTEIGAGVFIGSNSVLIAPVKIGKAAFVAAGSTITGDVPEGALAIARGREKIIEGWSFRWWNSALKRTRPGNHTVLREWLLDSDKVDDDKLDGSKSENDKEKEREPKGLIRTSKERG